MTNVGRPPKFSSVEQLESLIDQYFKACDALQRPYTITGLALYLDTTRETISDYKEKPEYSDSLKRAKLRCENWVEEGALTNKVNATSAIFNLKNNYGWKDKTESDVTSNGSSINPILVKFIDGKPENN